MVSANTAFAFDLFRQIAGQKPDANIFISPFSVSSALQMTANSAAGQTKSEMQQVLKTANLPPGLLNAAFKDLDGQFAARKDVTLNLANGLWYQRGFHLKPGFVADNRNFFQAELAGVDFGSSQSAAAINDWANRQTKGKIKQVVQYPFDPLTRLILANAIYFKGKWVEPFKPVKPGRASFLLPGGKSKQTPMMSRLEISDYQETPELQAVKLPYRGGLQMELYLPSTNSNPHKLLNNFAGNDKWRMEIQNGFTRPEGTVILPKFKLDL